MAGGLRLAAVGSDRRVRARLNVLLSCMERDGLSVALASNLKCDTVVISQCGECSRTEVTLQNGALVKLICTDERGLTKSRNMAIDESEADICLLCDDDETFIDGFEDKLIRAYEKLPAADIVIVRMKNVPCGFGKKARELTKRELFSVSSWQISFRRKSVVEAGVRFDELMGAGTPNGAEEELKFLTDCKKAGLRIFYAPVTVASVAQQSSTWFKGYDERFFENRGATTRYILGFFPAMAYGVYYIVKKRDLYKKDISPFKALKVIFKGIFENKIAEQKKEQEKWRR